MSLTAPERETIIGMDDSRDTASIYTAQRKLITKLKKNPAVVLLEEGVFEGSAWARFEMPANLISFRTVKKTIVLTEEQKQARAAQLRQIRGAS